MEVGTQQCLGAKFNARFALWYGLGVEGKKNGDKGAPCGAIGPAAECLLWYTTIEPWATRPCNNWAPILATHTRFPDFGLNQKNDKRMPDSPDEYLYGKESALKSCRGEWLSTGRQV